MLHLLPWTPLFACTCEDFCVMNWLNALKSRYCIQTSICLCAHLSISLHVYVMIFVSWTW